MLHGYAGSSGTLLRASLTPGQRLEGKETKEKHALAFEASIPEQSHISVQFPLHGPNEALPSHGRKCSPTMDWSEEIHTPSLTQGLGLIFFYIPRIQNNVWHMIGALKYIE